jgi:phage terminase Nu1 subunit (DNA packaging protein)
LTNIKRKEMKDKNLTTETTLSEDFSNILKKIGKKVSNYFNSVLTTIKSKFNQTPDEEKSEKEKIREEFEAKHQTSLERCLFLMYWNTNIIPEELP